jgi:hypothetical protein
MNLNKEELFELIGKDLTARQAFPLSKDELAERGKNWFIAKIDTFRDVLCSNKNKKYLVEDSGTKTAVLAISDLLASVCFGVSPVTVAAILLKIGIRNLCSNDNIEV